MLNIQFPFIDFIPILFWPNEEKVSPKRLQNEKLYACMFCSYHSIIFVTVSKSFIQQMSSQARNVCTFQIMVELQQQNKRQLKLRFVEKEVYVYIYILDEMGINKGRWRNCLRGSSSKPY